MGFVFGYENNNFNQIYLFLFFFCGKTSELLFRLKPGEGASVRTNDVYCHIAKET